MMDLTRYLNKIPGMNSNPNFVSFVFLAEFAVGVTSSFFDEKNAIYSMTGEVVKKSYSQSSKT